MGKKKKAKLKIPKEIAGVKVPKELRKTAKAAAALAENPMVRELLAAGLTAAAGVLTAKATAGQDESAATEEAKRKGGRGKRDALVAVAKDVALGVAAAYAAETRKKEKQKGSRAETPEPAAH